MTQTLQDHITSLHTLKLTDAIKAITTLTPGLKTSIQPKYGYFVTHSDYDGIADLQDLGRLWLEAGHRCFEEHAPLEVRLLHYQQTDIFDKLYVDLDKRLEAGLKDGSIAPQVRDPEAGCSCCAGVPSSVILCGFAGGKAFHFTPEEYEDLWGEQENSGWTYGIGGCESVTASLKQVEEALARTSGVEVVSML
ncbi:hypothetical protein PENARI_c009G11725 [Penicillium arizonense]|uniref:Uncharacterized protein n=1 Tax=Penicillium arizonense TaxID=1835702 RepID=A0A1F5LHT7_PENAI|nr:hypothetical protein PENARI_c009G11725 [Penicillium arizonense]OGE52626.1 hypothetical protein PENARI_c009G11725 [Penicillium arizonense]